MSHSIISLQQQQLFETFVCQPVSAWCANQTMERWHFVFETGTLQLEIGAGLPVTHHIVLPRNANIPL